MVSGHEKAKVGAVNFLRGDPLGLSEEFGLAGIEFPALVGGVDLDVALEGILWVRCVRVVVVIVVGCCGQHGCGIFLCDWKLKSIVKMNVFNRG